MLTCQNLVLGQHKWVFSPLFFLLCRKMLQLVPQLLRQAGEAVEAVGRGAQGCGGAGPGSGHDGLGLPRARGPMAWAPGAHPPNQAWGNSCSAPGSARESDPGGGVGGDNTDCFLRKAFILKASLLEESNTELCPGRGSKKINS